MIVLSPQLRLDHRRDCRISVGVWQWLRNRGAAWRTADRSQLAAALRTASTPIS